VWMALPLHIQRKRPEQKSKRLERTTSGIRERTALS
jgi:hypothetical protein